MGVSTYPLRVDTGLDPQLSRWRWLVKTLLAVPADAALMTDEHPPFRLDPGGHEPPPDMALAPPQTPATEEPGPARTGPPDAGTRQGWTGGRITSLVIGSLLALIALAVLAAGGVATWADNTQRDAGYVTTGTHSFTSTAYALTSGEIDLGTTAGVATPSSLLGTVRVRVTPVNSPAPIFVGIAPQSAVNRYLAGVNHQEITNWPEGTTTYRAGTGSTPEARPATLGFWTAQTSGTNTQTLTWKPRPGSWTVVVMNANAAPGVAVTADIGATVPDLGWIAVGLLVGGAILLLVAGALIVIPIVRASR
jgi:hypothetical protein